MVIRGQTGLVLDRVDGVCNESGVGEGGEDTTGGKGRGEAGEVTGVVANTPTKDGLGNSFRTFSGWGMAAGKVEVLLVVGGFDVDGGAEARLVNKDVNIKEGDMGRGDGLYPDVFNQIDWKQMLEFFS